MSSRPVPRGRRGAAHGRRSRAGVPPARRGGPVSRHTL